MKVDDDIFGAVADHNNEGAFLLLRIVSECCLGVSYNSTAQRTWMPFRMRAGIRESLDTKSAAQDTMTMEE